MASTKKTKTAPAKAQAAKNVVKPKAKAAAPVAKKPGAPAKAAAPKKAAPTAPAKAAAAPAVKPAIPRPALPKLVALPRPSLAAQFSGATSGANKLPPRLQAVIDQREIEQLLFLHCRALDRGEENILRSVYHPDATLDMGPGIFQGTVTDYINWVMMVLQQVKSSHTMISNMRIDVRGDEALGESYFMAQNRLDKPTGREDLFLAGRYLDRYERRPAGPAGVWKIVHRKQVLDWVRTEPAADIFYHLNPDALWGQRSKSDMSYQLEQFPGGSSNGGTNKLPTFVGRRYEGKSIKL